jgi:hypothetical protein
MGQRRPDYIKRVRWGMKRDLVFLGPVDSKRQTGKCDGLLFLRAVTVPFGSGYSSQYKKALQIMGNLTMFSVTI